jgi:ribonuclease R
MAERSGPILESRLLRLLGSRNYQPLTKTELARKLGVPIQERQQFRKLLGALELAGKITRIRKDRYVLPKEADLVVGTLQVNPQGFGYVLNESNDGRGDVYVSEENMGTAMHRDRVVARIIRDEPPRRARFRSSREGRIIRVLERANQTIVGTLQHSKKFYYVVPDDPSLVHDIYVAVRSDMEPRAPVVNDKVVVRLEPWEHRHVNPEGEIIEILGRAGQPGVDILSIIRKYDLPTEFPDSVLEEANRVPLEISKRELASREDLRAMPVFTIDPEDARDFDDAIHVVENKDGYTIGIHIADVSHYVKSGSALDREARRRGNSVYLPDRVLPMLPERLSNGVCSLRPDEDHLTKSVIVTFDRHGRIKGHRFVATVIRSATRLTYPQAFEILNRKPDSVVEKELHQAWRLASILRKRRFSRGALDLDMPEVRVRVDSEGGVIGLVREENDISHQLIEEFMLLANELVASATKEQSIPSVYRVHEKPDPVKLQEFREEVLSYGIQVGDLSHRQEVKRFLERLSGRPEEVPLKIGLLRSLQKAVYRSDPIGHYGLAKSDYTHFTSPIRRYSDLIVHRAFMRLLPQRNGKLPRSVDLDAICEHISLTERIAADSEREAVRLKKMEYFLGLVNKPQRFDGTVIEVRNYGLLVELKEALTVGLIHVSSLDRDFFVFDPVRRRVVGRRTKQSFGVGDRLIVRVTGVDMFKKQIDLGLVAKQ